MDEIERRFTVEQIGLQFYLTKKEQFASERRAAEMQSKLIAGELAKVLAPVFQSFGTLM